ncbi:MAG: carboxypeptidase regulatory-like domain-containing protein [Planctomycetales bacterium]|nr:carboxypeptidase regulatory-like domain-containing protein [Planctomycetales bacterium]
MTPHLVNEVSAQYSRGGEFLGPRTITLESTQQLAGRLIDSNGKPIAGRNVHAELRVRYKPQDRVLNAFHGFEVDHLTVQTNADGFFSFESLPVDVDIGLRADSTQTVDDHWLGTFELKTGQIPDMKTHTVKD